MIAGFANMTGDKRIATEAFFARIVLLLRLEYHIVAKVIIWIGAEPQPSNPARNMQSSF